jgi:hypothetical protein
VGLPGILRQGERLMLLPSARLVRRYGIPKAALKEAYGPGTPHAARVREIVRPVYALLGTEPR